MPKVARPPSIAHNEYAALRSDLRRCASIMSEIAHAHAFGQEEIRLVPTGSNLIAQLGEHLVVKLFPPFLRHQYESERCALRQLQARLSTPTPEIIIDCATAAWPYLIVTRLAGVPLGTIWETCSEDEKCAILRTIGRLIAEVQATPPGVLTELEPKWDDFVVRQAERCRRRHEQFGLPQPLLMDLDRYLEKTQDALPNCFRPVILTGEYTPDNLLMTRHADAWQVSGLIDFGDVMVGFSEYDLLGPGAFLAAGEAHRLQELLAGFGYNGPNLTSGLRQRLMRMLLLHRYSDLHTQVRIDGWQNRARDFDELESLLWPLGGAD